MPGSPPEEPRSRPAPALLLPCWLVACGGGPDPTPPPAPAAPPRPTSVLLVTLDTTRADALGAYGQARPVTPNLDRLAARGVVFEQCTTSSPSTLPSHGTMFTGKHPFTHGVRANAGYALRDAEVTLAERLAAAGYRTRAEIAAPVLAAHTGVGQGFAVVHGVDASDVELIDVGPGGGGHDTSEVRIRGAGDVGRHGVRFLEQVADQPFFLWLHYFDAHHPYAAPPDAAARFPDDRYLAEVSYADASVGEVLAALDRLGRTGDTLVVVAADHGEGLLQHDEDTHSYFVWDTTMRVPFLVAGPGVPAGRRVGALVRTVDLSPTVLDLLGLPPLDGVEGVSLRPLLAGTEPSGLVGYGESIELHRVFGSPVLRFVREGQWKYIHGVPPQLFDLAADPGETEDLAEREPARVGAMRDRLADLLRAARPADAASTSPGADTQATLEALGYVAGPAADLPDELASLDLGAPFAPASLAADVRALNLADGHLSSDRPAEAIAGYRALRARYPRSPELLRRLVGALVRQQGAADPEEVTTLLEEAVSLDTDNTSLFLWLAELAIRTEREAQAIELLRRVVDRDPCAERPRSLLLGLLARTGRRADHAALAEQGVQRCPSSPGALNDLAWILATSPSESVRNGARAVELATRATTLQPNDPSMRDTLAAALAEAGDLERARTVAAGTLQALERAHAPPEVLDFYRAHLAELQAGRPLRD